MSSPTCRSRAGTNPPSPGSLRHSGRIPVRSIRGLRFGRQAILPALLPELAREVHRVDPDVPIAETITLPVRMAGLTRPVRVAALFVGYAASLAMLLTAIGLYGALAFAVSRRTREIGIRLALGAARGRLVGSIVREGLTVVLAGAAIGVLLAIAPRASSRISCTDRREQTGCSTPRPHPSSTSWVSGRRCCRRVEPPASNQSSRFARSDRGNSDT